MKNVKKKDKWLCKCNDFQYSLQKNLQIISIQATKSRTCDNKKIYQILFTKSTLKSEIVRLVPQKRKPSGFLSCHSIL